MLFVLVSHGNCCHFLLAELYAVAIDDHHDDSWVTTANALQINVSMTIVVSCLFCLLHINLYSATTSWSEPGHVGKEFHCFVNAMAGCEDSVCSLIIVIVPRYMHSCVCFIHVYFICFVTVNKISQDSRHKLHEPSLQRCRFQHTGKLRKSSPRPLTWLTTQLTRYHQR
jgi:hypothetical protein